MKHRQTKKGIRKHHIYYLKRIGITVILCLSIATYAYVKFADSGDIEELQRMITLTAIILTAMMYGILRSYLPVIKYMNENDFIEVDENNIWITSVKLGNDRISFPLNDVKLFNHYVKPLESFELITNSGEEMVLEDYEQMDVLLEELKSSAAGSKYRRV